MSVLPPFEVVWKKLNKAYPDLLRRSQDIAKSFEDYVDFDALAEEEGVDSIEAELSWGRDPYVTEGMLKDYYEDLYEDLEQDLLTVQNSSIWRAVSLPIDVDPIEVNPLGIYWSRTQEGAEAYWGWETKGPTREIVFHAEAPSLSSVDVPGTLEANFIPEFGAEERELRLKTGSKIFLLSVILPDGKELPVEDWRIV